MRSPLKYAIAATLVCASNLFVSAAHADAVDPLIEGAKLCTRQLSRYEREYAIPTHLLSAIAATESGRFHQGLNINVPWPWTINAEGKGYYLNSKEEAVATAKKLRAQGVKSMDVGCMQVNLHHHANAFSSLESAFDPQTNVAYAASFLRSLYQESNSWKQASSDYHSKTRQLGTQYSGRVYNSWYQIIDKLRMAKLQLPSQAEMAAVQKDAPVSYTRKVVENSPKIRTVTALPEQTGKKVAPHRAPRMNVIELSKKDTSRENGVIIVRPEIKVVDDVKPTFASTKPGSQSGGPATIALAEAKPAVANIPAQTGSRVVRVEGAAAKKTGPRFIFSD